jgi:drug/metabolite transporter (DMT)-like permease
MFSSPFSQFRPRLHITDLCKNRLLLAQLEMKSAPARRGSLFWVAAGACLWGTDTIFRMPLTAHLSSATIVFLEHLILAVGLLPVLWIWRAEWLKLRWDEWAAVVGIAWGGSALGTFLFTEAVHRGNPTTAILLQKSQPVFAALLSGVFLLEPLGMPFWSRLFVALGGAYLIQFGWSIPSLENLSAAPFLALGAAALWGASTVLGRFLLLRTSFLMLTALRIVVALPPLAAVVWSQQPAIANAIDRQTAGELLFMALVPGFAGLMLYYRGLTHSPASRASVAELCFPATAVLLNWYFLKARLSIFQALGFVLLSVAILSWERRHA